MEQRISPPGKVRLGLAELWEYRELFYFFTWRDIKVKYKQTFLGFLWAVLQPFIMMLIFSFAGKTLSIASDGIPYPLFAYSGLMLWNVFSTGLSGAGNSMVNNANIIKKIYFPRLIIPMSSILVAVFDFLMAFIVYIGLVIYFDSSLSLKTVYLLPSALILTIIATFGVGLFIAALNVKYRDFRYVIPFLIQVGLFVTPIIYPLSMVGNIWLKKVLIINPMYAPISLIRNALIENPIDYQNVLISITSGLVFFVIGLLYFRKTESYFADLA